jgi:ABC-type sugar transport system ATPase subunit
MQTPASAPVALRAQGIDRSFPGVRALHDVDFDVRVGEVHGLVGENGAGKSTLVRIMTGADQAGAGRVEVFGHALPPADPRAAQRAGIGAIHQDLAVVPELSAAVNVFLGRSPHRGPFVSRAKTRRAFRRLAMQVGARIDPDARAGSLSVANQQMLRIMGSLAAELRVLLMDEPTASLGHAEREALYKTVRGLRASRVAIVYVSHNLDEVLDLCDRVSVMRDGELVATQPAQRWTKETLVAAILGRVLRTPPSPRRAISDEAALRVERLEIPGVLSDVSFTLRRGEVLGLGGLVGSGRSELLRALAGADANAGGKLVVDGRERSWPRTVRSALAMGIALVPGERKSEGLLLSLSAAANVCLTDMHAVAFGPVLSRVRRLERAGEIMGPLGFGTRRLLEPADSFSGGNQQKLVVGKWLHRRPDVLLMDEFVRGVDVGAKAEMLALVKALAADGMSIIVVSSELEDLVEAADRILVLARRELIGELGRAEASVEGILRLVFAVEDRAAREARR